MNRRSIRAAALIVYGFAAIGSGLAAQSPSQVPLVSGLVITSALHFPEGDRENVVTVASAGADGVFYTWDYTQQRTDDKGPPDYHHFRRRVLPNDLIGAPRIDAVFPSNAPVESPGFTAFSFSRAAYQKLITQKQMPFTITTVEGAGLGLGKIGGMFASKMTMRGTLSLVSSNIEQIPVLLNGVRTNLPSYHLKGQFALGDEKDTPDFWMLADSTHALLLRSIDGTDVLQTIRIDLPHKTAQLEQTLEKKCEAELPGIYFDFNSAALAPASQPALSDLADLLKKHADWTVSIEGHTDSIGGDASNQSLSERRAASVKSELVVRYHIAPARLTTAGHGSKQPVEPNTMIQGRAHNRRVELIRPCAKK